MHLDIQQPRFNLIDALFAVCNLPHGNVQRTMRQETLMSSVILAL